jgi:hypothetical protein
MQLRSFGRHRAAQGQHKQHCSAVDGWPSPDRPVPVVTHHNHTETTTRKVQLLCNGVATPPDRTSPMVFEFCSGLVDLVVGVGRHLGGGHRLALAASDS